MQVKRCHLGFTANDYAGFYASGLILKAEYEQYMTERFPGERFATEDEIKALYEKM